MMRIAILAVLVSLILTSEVKAESTRQERALVREFSQATHYAGHIQAMLRTVRKVGAQSGLDLQTLQKEMPSGRSSRRMKGLEFDGSQWNSDTGETLKIGLIDEGPSRLIRFDLQGVPSWACVPHVVQILSERSLNKQISINGTQMDTAKASLNQIHKTCSSADTATIVLDITINLGGVARDLANNLNAMVQQIRQLFSSQSSYGRQDLSRMLILAGSVPSRWVHGVGRGAMIKHEFGGLVRVIPVQDGAAVRVEIHDLSDVGCATVISTIQRQNQVGQLGFSALQDKGAGLPDQPQHGPLVEGEQICTANGSEDKVALGVYIK
ncbi:MAG: hypothetical protein Alpg2KO_16130 [Alphaproteobacteria bacterium]